MSRQLVIGQGQTGLALREVLSEKYNVHGIDVDTKAFGRFDVIHICIPYTDDFNDIVKNYVEQYCAPGGLIVIHSTVPLGTSNKHAAVHSPIRGVHPNLVKGIRTFVKFFGGSRALEAAVIFAHLGIKCWTTPRARNTEAMKLWDTTYYGWNIIFEKAVHEYCERHELDFDIVYNWANASYNIGYEDLGLGHVRRPVLDHKPGPIGGHCVIPNAKLLGGEVADFLIKKGS